MARLTYNKVSVITQPYPDDNCWKDTDAMSVKASVNALYDLVAQLRVPLVFFLTKASFSGQNYQDSANLINALSGVPLVAGKDFMLYTNSGSGALLSCNVPAQDSDGYTFNATTGTITAPPDNYVLIIFKQIST